MQIEHNALHFMWYAHIIADTIGAFKHVLARVIPLILNEPNSPRAATLLCGRDLKCLLISSSRFSSFLQGGCQTQLCN